MKYTNFVLSVVLKMSKYVEYTCDICGAEIIGHSAQAVAGESALIKLWTPGEYRAGPGQRMDLCLNCYERFIRFVEGGFNTK